MAHRANSHETPREETDQEPRETEIVKKTKENPDGDSRQDSVASAPSSASAERRFIPAAGHEGLAFESMVPSAIRE
jgi:hypothetical protein